jgi:hypothetical protein
VLKRHMKTLCGLILEKKGKPRRRLIVFIDDLDRCDLTGVVAVFEAVRLVMDLPQVFVVIAMDGEVALKAIASRYGGKDNEGAADMAREYLGKIVQVPIRLSIPSSLDLFLTEGLFPGATLEPRPYQSTQLPGDPERAKVSPASLNRAMMEENEEAARFRELARIYCFTAPRLLLRLRNSYRLLKLLNLLRTDKERYFHPKFLMKLLFFVEFLSQDGRRNRNEAEYLNALLTPGNTPFKEGENSGILHEASNLMEYPERQHLGINSSDVLDFVRSVVLPGMGGVK